MRRKGLYRERSSLRYKEKPHKAWFVAYFQWEKGCGCRGIYDKPCKGSAAYRYKAAFKGRLCTGGNMQQRKRQHLQRERYRNRGENVGLSRRGTRNTGRWRGCGVDRCNRSAAWYWAYKKRNTGACEVFKRRRQRAGGGGYNDHRYQGKGNCRQL